MSKDASEEGTTNTEARGRRKRTDLGKIPIQP